MQPPTASLGHTIRQNEATLRERAHTFLKATGVTVPVGIDEVSLSYSWELVCDYPTVTVVFSGPTTQGRIIVPTALFDSVVASANFDLGGFDDDYFDET